MGDTKNTSNSSGHTADEFATFFANKVDAIRQSTSSTALPDVAVTVRQALNEWELVTPETVVKLIGNAPNESCHLDAAPTWLVKQYSRLLAAFIALLFNASLSTGCFPAKFKHAIVTVDHALLLTCLQWSFSVEGGCLAWFTSYLSGRSYCVVINGVASHVIRVMCSVPRKGSVLGPLLFILTWWIWPTLLHSTN